MVRNVIDGTARNDCLLKVEPKSGQSGIHPVPVIKLTLKECQLRADSVEKLAVVSGDVAGLILDAQFWCRSPCHCGRSSPNYAS
jgi:hypothetical protein